MNHKTHRWHGTKDPREWYRPNLLKPIPAGYNWYESDDDVVTDTYGDMCDSRSDTDSKKLCSDCESYLNDKSRKGSMCKYGHYDKHKIREQTPEVMHPCMVPRDKTRNNLIEPVKTYGGDYSKGHKVRCKYHDDDYDQYHKRKKPLRIIDSEDSLHDIMDSSGQLRNPHRPHSAYCPEKKRKGKSSKQKEYLEILHALDTYNAKKRKCMKRESLTRDIPLDKRKERMISASKKRNTKITSRPKPLGKKSPSKIRKSRSVQTSIVLPPRTEHITRSKSVQTCRYHHNAVCNMTASQRNMALCSLKRSPSAPTYSFREQESTHSVKDNVAESNRLYKRGRHIGLHQSIADTVDGAIETPRPATRGKRADNHAKKASRENEKISIYEKKFQQKFQTLTRRAGGRKKEHKHNMGQDRFKPSLILNAAEIAQLATMIHKLNQHQYIMR